MLAVVPAFCTSFLQFYTPKRYLPGKTLANLCNYISSTGVPVTDVMANLTRL